MARELADDRFPPQSTAPTHAALDRSALAIATALIVLIIAGVSAARTLVGAAAHVP